MAELGIGMTILKVLAVVGGVAVGVFGTGWLVQLTCRLTIHRPVPQPALRLVRLLGGLAAGLAIWLWVSGPGSGGLGGMGLGMFGRGPGNENGAEKDANSAKEKTQTKKDQEPPKPTEVLRVVMLGGSRVTADRFYLIESGKQPSTLADVEKAIKEHQPPVKEIDVVIYLDSVPQMHSEVAKLVQRARDLDLTVRITKPGTNMPP